MIGLFDKRVRLVRIIGNNVFSLNNVFSCSKCIYYNIFPNNDWRTPSQKPCEDFIDVEKVKTPVVFLPFTSGLLLCLSFDVQCNEMILLYTVLVRKHELCAQQGSTVIESIQTRAVSFCLDYTSHPLLQLWLLSLLESKAQSLASCWHLPISKYYRSMVFDLSDYVIHPEIFSTGKYHLESKDCLVLGHAQAGAVSLSATWTLSL